MKKSLELRLERIKCLSNLQFQLLEYFCGYGGIPASELYASERVSIYIQSSIGNCVFSMICLASNCANS